MLQDKTLEQPSGWRNADTVCALNDSERHLGHVLRVAQRWHAFDATRFNEGENGFLFLGSYSSLTSAKQAVNKAITVNAPPRPRRMIAAG